MERSVLKRSTLAFRHLLEGYQDGGTWVPGDLELVLRGYGIFRDRNWLDRTRLPHLSDDGLKLRDRLESATTALIPALPEGERRAPREALQEATALYIREAAYTWFNRLIALRCLEARMPDVVDEAIRIKPDYANRSLRHDRFCRQHPELCLGEDGGLVAFLREVCSEAAKELPLPFDPDSPLTLVAPSPDALQKCIRALSGKPVDLTRRTGDRAEGLTDDVFRQPDLLGWVYQYWNDEEKDRVFEAAGRGKKIAGAGIIPATCIYTEDYMVRFLIENSLGALWAEMHRDSRLSERWQYFVRDVERYPSEARSVADLTVLDPACGSGHFLVYAFDLLWDMYQEEGRMTDPTDICRSILERNLYGIDIDERSIQIAAVALYLKAKERAPHFIPRRVNLVAANSSMPPDAIQRYVKVHPEDESLRGVLETIFEGLENVNEVGGLLQIEEQLDRAIEELRKHEARRVNKQMEQLSLLPLLGLSASAVQGRLDLDTLPPWQAWKQAVLDRLHQQFQREADAADLSTAIFGTEAEKGLDLEALEGLGTRDDSRFLRYFWEVGDMPGYTLLAKGGGYRKWDGLHSLTGAWGKNGERIKAFNSQLYGGGHWSRQIRNTHRYGQSGLTYTNMARGSLGVRLLPAGTIFGEKGPAIFVDGESLWALLGILNCRLISYILRTLSPSFEFRIGYLLALGIDPGAAPIAVSRFAQSCVSLKRYLMALDPIGRSFGGICVASASLTEAWRRLTNNMEAVATVLHTLEGLSERQVFAAYGIAGESLQTVLDETDRPPGWSPLVAGYDAPPELPGKLVMDGKLLEPLAREQRCTASLEPLADLKHRLRILYEKGSGANAEDDAGMGEGGGNNEEEQEVAVSGARIPRPGRDVPRRAVAEARGAPHLHLLAAQGAA